MQLLCVIPARIGSTRLPAKPLRLIAGVPLITRVGERVRSLDLGGKLLIATDDRQIADAVEAVGIDAIMTDSACRTGTERVAAVASRPEFSGFDLLLNVQGDEPFIPGDAIRGALARVTAGDPIGTAAAPLAAERARDPSRVKVAVDAAGHATAFSRAPLPAGEGALSAYLQHVGVYAYTRDALLRWVAAKPAPEERRQHLEQLRPLAYGSRIGVAILEREAPPGVDTEADVLEAERYVTAGADSTLNAGHSGVSA